jgi:hypothetical protein
METRRKSLNKTQPVDDETWPKQACVGFNLRLVALLVREWVAKGCFTINPADHVFASASACSALFDAVRTLNNQGFAKPNIWGLFIPKASQVLFCVKLNR